VGCVLRYLLRRVLGSIPVILVASFITFWLVRVAIDPLAKFRNLRNSARIIPRQRKALGLDQPIVVQWWKWVTHFVRGDMGTSTRTSDSVSSMVQHALWPSLQLLFWATIISVILAVILGVYSAVKQYSIGDYAFTGLSYVGIAMPDFWLALMAIALLVAGPKVWFHLDQPIFYSIGLHSEGVSGLNLDYFRHLALPVFTLTATSVAAWSRFERASMLEVLHSDYVRTARAKGVPRRQVIFKHALRNALIPFTTVTALDTAFLISGVIIIEQIFSIPGMGRGFLTALQAGDAPFLLAWFFFGAVAVIGFNLLADFIYVALDPRIRLT
jgi:peptide/nickel transport system permease protein